MKQKLRDAEVDTRTVPEEPDEAFVQWLGEHYIGWGQQGPTICASEGFVVYAKTGWVCARWDDGWLSVSSTGSAARIFCPVES